MPCLSHTHVKRTRKEHQCFGCFATIPIGERAEKQFGVDGGSSWSIVFCAECSDWLKANPSFWEECPDGCSRGDVGESRRPRCAHGLAHPCPVSGEIEEAPHA